MNLWFTTKLCSVAIITLSSIVTAGAQVRAWERFYAGPGSGASDYGYDIAADASGNVYVAGTSRYRSVCIKYDAQGNELWVRSFVSRGATASSARKIVIDPQGNACVVGTSHFAASGSDYLTMKYDPDGNLLWACTYTSPGRYSDIPQAVAADQYGNVFVVGNAGGAASQGDIVIVKYGAQGSEVWTRTYVGSFDSQAIASATYLDTYGNLYVTGSLKEYVDGAFTTNFVTIKYDVNGEELWVRKYGHEGQQDSATSVTVDTMGNVYVAGQVYSGLTSYDIALVKYDSAGNQLWSRHYNHSYKSYERAATVRLDSSGNVYVSGSTGTVTWSTRRYLVLKYDTVGNLQWSRTGEPVDGGLTSDYWRVDMGLDSSGAVYLMDQTGSTLATMDYLTAKYDSEGNALWTRRYNGPSNGGDLPAAIVVTADSVYVTGSSDWTSISPNIATVKYDFSGAERWVRTYDGPSNGLDAARALAVDKAGRVVVTGLSDGGLDGSDLATLMYDSDGRELWVGRYGDAWTDAGNAIGLDDQGNVYVGGSFQLHAGWGSSLCTLRYDMGGTRVWSRFYNVTYPPGGDEARALVIGGEGDFVYVTGSSTVANSDISTIKYSSSGDQLWVARYNGPAGKSDEAVGIALDPQGNVHVLGTSDGGSSGPDITIIKYDPDGSERWVRRYVGPEGSTDRAAAIAVDSQGSVFAVGTSDGDMVIIKYDRDGSELWVRRYDHSGGDDTGRAIALDAHGNAIVVGGSSGDFVTLKYAPDGTLLWLSRYGGSGNSEDQALSVAVDSVGNVYVAGETGDGLTSSATLVKYDRYGKEVWVDRIESKEGRFAAVVVDHFGNAIATGEADGDYITVKYLAEPKSVSGRVLLDQFVGDPRMWPVTFELREPGTKVLLDTRIAPLSVDGFYSFDTLLGGNVDLSAKASQWLRSKQRLDLYGNTSGVDWLLVGGDANGDNRVDLMDLNIALLNFMRQGPYTPGDVDGNSQVDQSDISLILQRFDRVGAD